MALVRRHLDDLVCNNPNCDHVGESLVVHSRCHPRVPAWVWYSRERGVLRIHCAECDKLIVEILVAKHYDA